MEQKRPFVFWKIPENPDQCPHELINLDEINDFSLIMDEKYLFIDETDVAIQRQHHDIDIPFNSICLNESFSLDCESSLFSKSLEIDKIENGKLLPRDTKGLMAEDKTAKETPNSKKLSDTDNIKKEGFVDHSGLILDVQKLTAESARNSNTKGKPSNPESLCKGIPIGSKTQPPVASRLKAPIPIVSLYIPLQ
ncbi:hypothetical protein ROZALSC1DRAFT_27004 [Rozella allomycis CSF55]|uniref:Uncharacterized protein n=1 Tax=Rozella allomycis (strain CSF55) TaxID=988480 RepID=A0A075AR10_ROZAC|nr:hypothetical protein O9G_003796 [Rozella allomycis CSF55]RKP21607.1 hypothetical protein ROZALSC1DRAFT_27004 [Rozella allomycis CSF55]|eukprot:EPZ32668.1 hypothetical protein O9G_003796 [Rozella allomycis CSF55]